MTNNTHFYVLKYLLWDYLHVNLGVSPLLFICGNFFFYILSAKDLSDAVPVRHRHAEKERGTMMADRIAEKVQNAR